MSAPTPTARVTPATPPMPDGFSSKITIELDPDIEFWEREVTPPGFQGDAPIEVHNMFNTLWKTKAPPDLIEMTEMSGTVGYSPAVLTSIVSVLQKNTVITMRFPGGATWAFWGYLSSFVPSPLSRTTHPEATITIVPTMRDNSGVERAPVHTAGTGTGV